MRSDDVRRHLFDALRRLADADPEAVGPELARLYSPEARWRGSQPFNEIADLEGVEAVWRGLKQSLPDLERRDDIFLFGAFEGRDYVAAAGHYCGTFARDWLGVRATGRPVFLRYGEAHEIVDGRIGRSSCLWDVLDLMRQAGQWPLGRSAGREGRWPAPLTGDGVRLASSDPLRGRASLAQTLAMQETLGAANGPEHLTREGLLAMPQRDHWHPKMMWYGPSGVGMTRGLAGFVDQHQLPFRRGFPGRKGGPALDREPRLRRELGAGHFIRIGDGPYSVTGGWPSVVARHEGPWLGLPATGRQLAMRVMDFYLHDEGRIRENWVPIDVIDVLGQMGLDVFARLRETARGAG